MSLFETEMRLFGWDFEQWQIVCGWFKESPRTLLEAKSLRNRWRGRFFGKEPGESVLFGVKMPKDEEAADKLFCTAFEELKCLRL